jgi:two-component system LytT family response regulator
LVTVLLGVLIVDDEPLARTVLTNLLALGSDVQHFASAKDAIETIDKAAKSSCDVLFLDINMPEIAGMALLDRLTESDRPVPSIVFVTARPERPLHALPKPAVDSVAKPLSGGRVHEGSDTTLPRNARSVEAPPRLQDSFPKKPARIGIKTKGRILFLDLGEVAAVHAEGNYVSLKRESGSHTLRESISEIEKKLKPYGFIRIHRSVLVNGSFVEEIQPWATGEYGLRLKGGKEYTVTRTYKKNLRSLAEFWIGTDTFLPD